jgi:hypothetical protein
MDFGVSHNGPIPGGGVLLGEKVQIILEIEAFRQAAGWLRAAGPARCAVSQGREDAGSGDPPGR